MLAFVPSWERFRENVFVESNILRVGVPELTFSNRNLAEVEAVPPIAKSTVEFAGYKRPFVCPQKLSPPPLPQVPQVGVPPPDDLRHSLLAPAVVWLNNPFDVA
jgi:hypothetical protein